MSRTVEELLGEAVIHLDAAAAYARTDTTDPTLVLDAMSMRLFAGLETLTRLPDDMADRLFVGRWADMRGLRNRIAHGYGGLDLVRLRATVDDELPQAIDAMRRELTRY